MMNGQNLSDQNGLDDDLDGLLSMGGLMEFDMGKYTVKHLPGSERLYKLKMDRPARLMDTMAAYRKEQRYCDVVFRVNQSRHPAHRVVLASASTYFASMFGHASHLEAQITEDIDFTKWVPCPTVMDLILDFIYTSEVQLNDKVVMGLLASCMPLLLDDLVEFCVTYLRDHLHPSNSVGLFLYGKQHHCQSLVNAAQDYMFDHFEEVVRHEEFLTLNINDLCSIIKDDNLKVRCETIVYTAAMQWMRHDPSHRKDVMMQILPCIRLPLIAPAFLQGAMDCDEFATVDMKRCRDYLSTVHEDLTTHRYRCLPRRRAPLKPLVIYCAGGYHNRSINTMECYFLPTRVWKRCADLKFPRSGVGVVSLHMRVYVIGGRHNTKNENKDCRDVERYDPFMNKWSSLPPMRYARNRLGVGAIDHSIYAVGGSSGQQLYSSVERYTIGAEPDAWVEVTSMHVARIGPAVCTHSRLLYAMGGFDGHRRLADVESYDPDTNIWKREEPLRIGRSGAAAAPLAECIYVVGGYASDSIDGPMQLDSVERFNIITQQWTFVRPMNCHRSALSCVALENRLIALGGYDGKNFSSVVEVYDPEKDEWTYGTPLTRERSGHGSALTVEPSLDNDE